MTAKQARNMVAKGLYRYIGIPVYRSGQAAPEAQPPYITHSVISPYQPGGTLGHFRMEETGEGETVQVREEQAMMSLSFTACSRNRTGADGEWVNGDEEAMDLAEKAQGWFLHAGREFLSPDVVVESVENVACRNTLMVEEEADRYGFDVRVTYIRKDVRKAGAVYSAKARKGDGKT